MSKLILLLVLFISMVMAGIISFVIMINEGGLWTAAPIILWFVIGQIFIVPKILEKDKD